VNVDGKTLNTLAGAAYRPVYESMVRRYEALLATFPEAFAAPAWQANLDWYRAILAGLDGQENA
jgi:hypothetical protein